MGAVWEIEVNPLTGYMICGGCVEDRVRAMVTGSMTCMGAMYMRYSRIETAHRQLDMWVLCER